MSATRLHSALASQRSGAVRDSVVKLVQAVKAGGAGEIYSRLAKQLVEQLVGLLSRTQKQVGYLRPLVRAGLVEGGITVATLNYDLSVEQAAAAAAVPVHTGFPAGPPMASGIGRRRAKLRAEGPLLSHCSLNSNSSSLEVSG